MREILMSRNQYNPQFELEGGFELQMLLRQPDQEELDFPRFMIHLKKVVE